MHAIRNFLHDGHTVGQQMTDSKAAYELNAIRKPQSPVNVCVEGLVKNIAIELLYFDKVVRGSTTLSRFLRDCHILKDVECTPYQWKKGSYTKMRSISLAPKKITTTGFNGLLQLELLLLPRLYLWLHLSMF